MPMILRSGRVKPSFVPERRKRPGQAPMTTLGEIRFWGTGPLPPQYAKYELRRAATAKVDKKAWSRVVVWSPHGDEGEWSGADPTEFRKTLPAFDDSEYWGDITEPCLLVCDDVMLPVLVWFC